MKYFFLSASWCIGRVWEVNGLWNDWEWRRPPQIEKLALTIVEGAEQLHLYRVEPAVLMVEVQPQDAAGAPTVIGQVVLKRLITADQVIDRLTQMAQTTVEQSL
jgi:hypothetical protein